MQVTHLADKVTHAVIGKVETQDFGIASTAEFFNILSKSLYSDEIMAAVRETMCNAWDIHIETGRTHKPIVINLTREEYSVQDQGTGISREMMHPTYCVYGASTKELDGNVTGGFGLGCKSPFAVVDHFEVESAHAGQKTIYAISKSSAEVKGKPGMTPIVTVPCGDETGVKVSFKIENRRYSRYEELIRLIALYGEMNVIFNGEQLKTLPFSKAKLGFMLTKILPATLANHANRIFVRYGNVVYPVPSRNHENLRDLIRKIESNTLLNGYKDGYYLVLQAKPNTISVTPSRESLSSSDSNIEQIRILLEKCKSVLNTNHSGIFYEVMSETFKTLPETYESTFKTNAPEIIQPQKAMVAVHSKRDVAVAKVANYYKSDGRVKNRLWDLQLRMMEKLEVGGPLNRGMIQSLRREARKPERNRITGTRWLRERIFWPLLTDLKADPAMDPEKLMVLTEDREYTNYRDGFVYVHVSKFKVRDLEKCKPFLRNIVVLAFNKKDAIDRPIGFPVVRQSVDNNLLVYQTPRNAKHIPGIRKFFEDRGMTVIDLTVRHPWESELVTLPIPKPQAPLKRLPGIARADVLVGPSGNYYNELAKNPSRISTRIEEPQFVITVNPNAQSSRPISWLNDKSLGQALKRYGHLGGIVTSYSQEVVYKKKGIPCFEDWLIKMFSETIKNGEHLVDSLLCGENSLHFHDYELQEKIHNFTDVLEIISYSTSLSKSLGHVSKISEEEIYQIKLFNTYVSAKYRNGSAIYDSMPRKTFSPSFLRVIQKISSSVGVQMLNCTTLARYANDTGTDDQSVKNQKKAVQLLLAAIKN